MEEILWRKYTRHFVATDYPLTDQLAEGEVAPTGAPKPIAEATEADKTEEQ